MLHSRVKRKQQENTKGNRFTVVELIQPYGMTISHASLGCIEKIFMSWRK
jgi:hypothetical protein